MIALGKHMAGLPHQPHYDFRERGKTNSGPVRAFQKHMQPPACLVCHQRQPENLESPRSIFESFLTPRDLFYVRSHFETPHIEVAAWRLPVEGEVERPVSLTFPELLDAPQRNVTATLECAGNSRSFLPVR
jgi:DMSO/TMAO reductase YedYZ molybdopterin-dependent catalytic subunit